MKFPNFMSKNNRSQRVYARKNQLKHRLSFMPGTDSFDLEQRVLLAKVTWTGAGGNMNWGDAANWDLGRVPNNTDDAVTPDLPGTQTILINSTATVLSVNSAEGLTLSSGDLNVTAGVSVVSGTFTLAGGRTFTARGNSTVFTAPATANLINSSIKATNEAQISFGGTINANGTSFYAETGGRLGSSSLIKYLNTMGGYSAISAKTGGTLSFPSLTSINVDGAYYARTEIIAANATSSILLPKLQELNDQGTDYHSSISAIDGATIEVATSTTACTTGFDMNALGGARLFMPGMANITVGSGYADYIQIIAKGANSTIDLSGLSRMNDPNNSYGSGITVQDQATVTVATSSNATVNGFSFTAETGGSLLFQGLTAYTNTSGNYSTFTAKTGGTLSFPSLTSINVDGAYYARTEIIAANATSSILFPKLQELNDQGTDYHSSISAIDGATIEVATSATACSTGFDMNALGGARLFMPGMSNITAGSGYYDNIQIIAKGANSTIDLSGLSRMNDPNNTYGSGITVQDQATVTVATSSNATVNGFSFTAETGGSLLFQGLTAYTNTSGNYSTFTAKTGGTLSLPNLKSISIDNQYSGRTEIIYDGIGSTISMPKLQSLDDQGSNYQSAILARNGANASIFTDASWSFTNFYFTAQSDATLEVVGLTTAINMSFQANTGGTLILPDLVNVTGGYFGANWDGDTLGRGSKIVLSKLTETTGSTEFRARDGGSIEAPSLTTLQADTFWVFGNNATATLPGLTTANASNLRVDNGGTLVLPSLTNVTVGNFGANWDGDSLNRPSRLLLSNLVATKGGTTFRARDGAIFEAPNLTTLNNDAFYVWGNNTTTTLPAITTANGSTLRADYGGT